MSLNNIFKGKILKANEGKSAAIVIRDIQAYPDRNSVSINCRYFDIMNHEDGMSDIDVFEIGMNEFISQFSILTNSDKIDSFKQGIWEPLEKYLDEFLKETI